MKNNIQFFVLIGSLILFTFQGALIVSEKCSMKDRLNRACPKNFSPVCGIDAEMKLIGTFANKCLACNIKTVDSYQECPPSETFSCDEPRPEICTLDYVETCGLFFEEENCMTKPCWRMYGNSCSACSDIKVERYFYGACPNMKLHSKIRGGVSSSINVPVRVEQPYTTTIHALEQTASRNSLVDDKQDSGQAQVYTLLTLGLILANVL